MPRVTTPRIEEGSDEIGTFRAELLSDSGGLTQFGAFVETLSPGSASSRPHWHANEDEMIHVLAGTVTLVEGDTSAPLSAGDSATFKAGVPVGHCLRNESAEDVKYLVIGTRSGDDVVTYTDGSGSVTIKDGIKTYRDAAGQITRTAPDHST